MVNWNANTANTKQLSVSETPVTGNFEKRALQARGEVRGKGKTNKNNNNSNKNGAKQRKSACKASREMDWLALADCVFFFALTQFFFRLIFPLNAELVQGYLDLALLRCCAVLAPR